MPDKGIAEKVDSFYVTMFTAGKFQQAHFQNPYIRKVRELFHTEVSIGNISRQTD